MSPLTTKEQATHNNSDKCHICNKKFITDESNKYYKKLRKVKDHDHYNGKYRGAAHSICNLRYATQRHIVVAMHNGSNYDVHLIIKELAKDFKSNMNCRSENTEKYMTFSIPIKKQKENGKLITYRLKFVDTARFMMGSLSNHVDNLS